MEIIKLPEPFSDENMIIPGKEEFKGNTDEVSDERETKDDAEKTEEVHVICYNQKGKILRTETIKIPYGTSKAVPAEAIDGYHVISDKVIVVKVSPTGYVDSPVTFVYQKDSGNNIFSRFFGRREMKS